MVVLFLSLDKTSDGEIEKNGGVKSHSPPPPPPPSSEWRVEKQQQQQLPPCSYLGMIGLLQQSVSLVHLRRPFTGPNPCKPEATSNCRDGQKLVSSCGFPTNGWVVHDKAEARKEDRHPLYGCPHWLLATGNTNGLVLTGIYVRFRRNQAAARRPGSPIPEQRATHPCLQPPTCRGVPDEANDMMRYRKETLFWRKRKEKGVV
jgi:hypothetical protein